MLPRHISELWLPSVKFGRHKYIYIYICSCAHGALFRLKP